MAKLTILVVEDDATTAELVRSILEAEHYTVSWARSVLQARSLLRKCLPALLVLDRNLPDKDGIEFLRELRASPETVSLPVLFLTARGAVMDRVLGLRLGGDDYLAKPFNPEELVARVEALARRAGAPAATPGVLAQGALRLELDGRIAFLEDREISLTEKQFDLLRAFVERSGRVLSRTFLLAHVWGYGTDLEISTKAIDVMVVGLRRKLGRCGRWIETVRGFGYRFRQS